MDTIGNLLVAGADAGSCCPLDLFLPDFHAIGDLSLDRSRFLAQRGRCHVGYSNGDNSLATPNINRSPIGRFAVGGL